MVAGIVSDMNRRMLALGLSWVLTLGSALGCGSETEQSASPVDVADNSDTASTDASDTYANDTSVTDSFLSDVQEFDVDLEDSIEPVDGIAPDTQQACEPPLSLGPADPVVPQFGYLQLLATGGSGNYRFTLLENESGAVVNLLTGSYLAGGTSSVTDTILLEDTECGGEATLAVQVVDDPALTPEKASIPPNACLQFDVQFGSGDFSFEIVSGTPMGTIDESGLYVAGDVSGSDIVRVRDLKTDQTNDAVIIIDPTSDLQAAPAKLFIPLGSEHRLPVVGGSGHYSVVSSDDSVVVDVDTLIASEVGTALVSVTDKHVSCVGSGTDGFLQTQVEVTTLSSLNLPGTLANSGGWAHVLGPGDLDGDGIDDAIMTHDRSNLGGYRSGAVAVFKGTVNGLEKTPSWWGTSGTRSTFYGRFAHVADMNGDGEKDLLVASPEDSLAGDRFGAVYLYLGVSGGFFEDTRNGYGQEQRVTSVLVPESPPVTSTEMASLIWP